MQKQVTEFDPKVCEAIGVYVYALRDPRTNIIFYVGKGVGNRCFNHVSEAQVSQRRTDKLDTIRALLSGGFRPIIEIVRHGLDHDTAHHVESALIDILDLTTAGNLVRGHGVDLGHTSAEELQIRYGALKLESNEPLLLIKINRLYKAGMTIQEVYEVVRWSWRLNIARAQRARYVLAVANGIVRGVFADASFYSVTSEMARNAGDNGRVYFEAEVVGDSPYLWRSTEEFGKRGQASPIRYLNIQV